MDDYYNDPNPKPTPVKRDSLLSKSAQSMDEPDRREFKKEIASGKRASRLEKTSPSSSISSSFDGTDLDKEVDIQMLYENTSFDSKRTSYDINAIDEEVLRKYRPLIRFFNYLLFLRCMRKFKRLRKPYQLLDAETELCEMEHNRNQLFHDLEIKLEATIGKPSPSPFHHSEGKLSIEKRLEAVEQHTEDMDGKVQEIIRLAEAIAEIVGCDQLNKTVQTERATVQAITREKKRKIEELRMNPMQLLIEKFERNLKARREKQRRREEAVIDEAGEMPDEHCHTLPKISVCRRKSIVNQGVFIPPDDSEINEQ